MSVQDRCTVCAKRTIGLDNVINAPMLLLGDEAQVEAHCAVCAQHTIGSEIILDSPDETPR